MASCQALTRINLAKPLLNSIEQKQAETDLLGAVVQKFLKKRMITPTKIQPDDFFFSLFTGKKKDGSYRTILSLKYLDEECYTQHFKMEYIRHAIYMINAGMFLASLDIKDAFYSEVSQVFAQGKSSSV